MAHIIPRPIWLNFWIRWSEGSGSRSRATSVVAELLPPEGAPQITVQEAIAGLRDFRSRHPLGPDVSIKQLIDEGRRF